MKDSKKNTLRRRDLLFSASAGVMTASLDAGQQTSAASSRPTGEGDAFSIRALDRRYAAPPKGCTLLAIEVASWPGNEFGLWLPETVYIAGTIAWGNRWDNAHQEFGRDKSGHWTTTRTFEHGYWTPNRRSDQFTMTSTLIPDPAKSCLWYRHTFEHWQRDTA